MRKKRKRRKKKCVEEEQLTCFYCHRTKPVSEFEPTCLNSILPRYICRLCVEWQKLPSATKSNRYARVRVILHYGGYVCVDCGNTDEAVLVLHHIHLNGTKRRIALLGEKYKYNVPAYYRKVIARDYPPEDEMVVVCRNCHALRHAKSTPM